MIAHEKARKYLSKADPILGRTIRKVGACSLVPNPDHFRVLASSILSQQISVKAADTIKGRLIASCGRGGLTVKNVTKLDDETIRNAGVSTNKAASLRSLCAYFTLNSKSLAKLDDMTDEEVIEFLLPIRGIGVWTAQMFLMFSMGRPDVLPVGDLGFKLGVRDLYEFEETPTDDELREIGEKWAPYRSIATWYVWRARDA
jgi:DNA-3-methyladenine glycosylase II